MERVAWHISVGAVYVLKAETEVTAGAFLSEGQHVLEEANCYY
jgi:hypothetical protein